MSTYLGIITIRNKYVNFKPLYECERGNLTYLSQYDRQAILPESQYGDINFYYASGTNKAADYFIDGEYIILDLCYDDLEDNIVYGERNPTGYKIDLSKIDSNKIQDISEINLFYIVRLQDVEGNYRTNPTLIIKDPHVYEGMRVVLPLSDQNDTVLGPYEVEWREVDNNCCIRTGLENQKYVVQGYKFSDSISNYEIEIGRYEEQHTFLRLDSSACSLFSIDVITEEQLLQSFRSTISREDFIDGQLSFDNIGSLLSSHKVSLFVGDGIPKDIRENRFETLRNILTDEENLNETFGFISDTISDLLAKYQGKPQYDELVRKLADNPDFMSNIQRYKIITDTIEKKQIEVEELERKESALQQQIEEHNNQEYASGLVGEYEGQIQDLQGQKSQIEQVIAALEEQLDIAKEGISLKERLGALKADVSYKEQRDRDLDRQISILSEKIDTIFSDSTEKAMRFTFDGMLSSRMLQQAAEWESRQNTDSYTAKASLIKTLPISSLSGDALIDYLVSRISEYRPNYDRNTILNILICYVQGFLTVFSGAPGCGKTSICRILSIVLGLTLPSSKLPESDDGFVFDRFIPISVERGWTTKRDFIGYYNPLTKSFDRSNRRIFDALNILDIEASEDGAKLPFEILLDEANLSPMEYYWADYMNICDDIDSTSVINLGNDYCFRVPKHLRFVATINNDHTTEALSPRLIDRAWVIKLPKVKSGAAKPILSNKNSIELISWDALRGTFDVSLADATPMDSSAKSIYDELLNKCRNARINVSPRADSAIRRYWAVAQRLFSRDADYDRHQFIVALDYAVSQRILPHIDGSGEKYCEALTSLANYCSSCNLKRSADIVHEIIQQGEDTMQYYQFFA